jgi:hypothetical protein
LFQSHPGGNTQSGNAIFVNGAGNLYVSGCILRGAVDVSPANQGGVVTIVGGSAIFWDTIVENGTTSDNGGCINLQANLTLINTHVRQCVSGQQGGALYVKGSGRDVTISGSTFGSADVAGLRANSGGAMYFDATNGLSLNGSSIGYSKKKSLKISPL